MGVSTKETPFEVAEASDIVITMLPSSSHVSRDMFFSPFLLKGSISDLHSLFCKAMTCVFYDLTLHYILLHSS